MERFLPAPLLPGPVDVIGDVHGEIDALRSLEFLLGYEPDGSHPANRRLVFLGDLCDRGPDSPAVVRHVAGLVAAGRAQCVLGNHELNLLRGARKPGNGWFFDGDHDREIGKFTQCTPATAADRSRCLQFLGTLPLALERTDLRIVHAAWHRPAMDLLQDELAGAPLLEVYAAHGKAAEQWAAEHGIQAEAAREYRQWGRQLADDSADVPLLPGIGRQDEHSQMANPVRVLTSGVERLADETFFASGKWRMVNRVPWWNDYLDPTPVIFGHYWRWATAAGAALYSRGEQDLFAGIPSNAWLGPNRNAFCVDFSVGVRYRERPLPPGTPWRGRLGAIRWPERELLFDDGERLPLVNG